MSTYVDLFLMSVVQRVAPTTYGAYRACGTKYCKNLMVVKMTDFVPTTIQHILDKDREDGRSVSYRHQLWACLGTRYATWRWAYKVI